MGTSLCQRQSGWLAWCLCFLCHLGLIFAFISRAPSVPSPPPRARPSGHGHLCGVQGRLSPAVASRAPHGPAAAPARVDSRLRSVPPCRAGGWTAFLTRGKHPRDPKSVCLGGAEPGGRERSEARTATGGQDPAAGPMCGPRGGRSCVFRGGAGRGAPGQVPLSSLPSGGRWAPTAGEGCSGVHVVPQHPGGPRVGQAWPRDTKTHTVLRDPASAGRREGADAGVSPAQPTRGGRGGGRSGSWPRARGGRRREDSTGARVLGPFVPSGTFTTFPRSVFD